MTLSEDTMNDDIEQQASHWHQLQQERELSTDEHNTFQQWLLIDPAHEQAYERQSRVDELLSQAVAESPSLSHFDPEAALASLRQEEGKAASNATINATTEAANDSHYGWWAAAASVVFAIGLAWLTVFNNPETIDQPIVSTERHQTQVAELKTIRLNDGSVIELAAASDISVTLSENRRNVQLTRGEAYFDIASDPQRPFNVNIDRTSVQVLGTEFNVRKSRNKIAIAVAEGQVAVEQHPKGQQQQSAELVAGQQVISTFDEGLSEIETIDIDSIRAWQQGRLVFDDAPLSEVVEHLRRYYPKSITLVTPGIAKKRVSASFDTDAIESTLPGSGSQCGS